MNTYQIPLPPPPAQDERKSNIVSTDPTRSAQATAMPQALAVSTSEILPSDEWGSEKDLIGADVALRGREFLSKWIETGSWGMALTASGLTWAKLKAAIKASKLFSQAYYTTEEEVRQLGIHGVEETLMKTARGQFSIDRKCYPPSDRAAQIYLAANDERYRQGGAVAATAVNIQVNL